MGLPSVPSARVVPAGVRPVLILLLPLFCAASARAADLPVLARDGAVHRRFDPGVAARDTTAPPPYRAVRRAAVTSRNRTTLSELRRMQRGGSITSDEYRAYRDEYERDRAFARGLSGARELDMKGVLATVDRMAARGVLTRSRLVPLWLQL